MTSPRCPHPDAVTERNVCQHLLARPGTSHHHRFTGSGIDYDLICESCARDLASANEYLVGACAACVQHIRDKGSWEGIVGRPAIAERPTSMRFDNTTIRVPSFQATQSSAPNRRLGHLARRGPSSLAMADSAGSMLPTPPSIPSASSTHPE